MIKRLTQEQLKQLRKAIQESQDALTAAARAANKAESLKTDAVDAQNRLTRLMQALKGEHSEEDREATDFALTDGKVIYGTGTQEELKLRGELAALQNKLKELEDKPSGLPPEPKATA